MAIARVGTPGIVLRHDGLGRRAKRVIPILHDIRARRLRTQSAQAAITANNQVAIHR